MSPSALISHPGHTTDITDVCIVGAGPAGLMLADNLARYGVKAKIVDERVDQTSAGRADGLQPKTIETLRMLRLADDLVRVSTKVYDICIWGKEGSDQIKREGRQIHYPHEILDVTDPYILLCHQGMVEATFIKAMAERGLTVQRSTTFDSYNLVTGSHVDVTVLNNGQQEVIVSRYLVGCDGAHSKVRKAIPGAVAEGSSTESVWGVLDGELVTDFPDIWSKTIVVHPEHGTVLIIPRERGMTRFYIELKRESTTPTSSQTQEEVMERAQKICAPYFLDWKTVEWFGRYQIGQRVASKFMDDDKCVFIAGDASHTHSPKAAQGLNTSVHDSWNLSWKLNLQVRGLAKPALIETYETERRKIGQDLINFDYEHANQIAAGDSQALAENFRTNIRFISGIGVEYATNILNRPLGVESGTLRPGSILTPAKAIRYIDHNPVDLQVDIPILGQFRIYVVIGDITTDGEASFLRDLNDHVKTESSTMSKLTAAARKSYTHQPRRHGAEDVYFLPERYTTVSDLFTFAMITTCPKDRFELHQLPHLWSASPWTVYLDGGLSSTTHPESCATKWVGGLKSREVAIVLVRPDNYVGSVSRWRDDQGTEAGAWLDQYFDGFLKA